MNEPETSAPICAVADPAEYADDETKKQRFERALAYLVAIAHDGGLHASDMVAGLTFWAGWAKDNR
jgi:hypothetical protein